MGRSKFPGKPPKTVTRKRIKVLGQPETAQSDSVTVAENIYYGLSLFNETFGDNEKEHPPFHGFSTKEANLSVSYIKTQQHDTKSPSVKPAKECPSETNGPSENKDKEDIKRAKFHRPKSRKNIKFSNFMKTPVLKSVNNILDQHQRTRQLRNSTAKRLLQRAKSNSITAQCGDKQSAVRKFILPVRSAHSSRVIKPNKRFIEELEEISEQSENEISTQVKKAKFALNKLCDREENISKLCTKLRSKDAQDAKGKSKVVKNQKPFSVPTKVLPDPDVPSSESSRIQTRSGMQNEPVDLGAQTDNFDTESSLSESGSEHSNHSEDEQSEWTGMKLNGGKVILRKARLKLDNKCVGGTEGPFSTTNSNSVTSGNTNLGLTGTIKCGVCGAVRFYRFVKQARKFGIHSCESCRKFISKMIKRQACAKSTNSTLPILQCHKGDGLCLVPPVVRSQQWNLMRCVYKARCPACWLKMCLKCYNIPSSLRTGLNALLPAIMRDPLSVPLSLSQEDDSQGQKLISCKLGWPAEDSSEKNLFKSAMSWRNMEMGQKTSYQGTGGFLYTKLDKFDSTLNISPSKKRRKNNRIKVRKKLKNPMFSAPSLSQCPPPLRQRLELKGPRVKHVCRSASVALGQPIATFPSLDGKEDAESNKNIPKTKENDRIEKKGDAKEKEQKQSDDAANVIQQAHPKRGKQQQNLQMVPKANNETIHSVSIDFWEQYDPAEVGAKGFALIGSELFHIPAICYLCGSAGKEPLIHCQCCCEPYHAFCLEPSEWNACAQPNWCCPRCTVCQSCHERSGPKLSCIRCRQSFHHSCLSKCGVSARLYSPERPYVCQSCVKCKSCGSEGVSVHVGNLPLCSMCFKLRQQGNYCPLCQRCYNENDFDTKMMECSECSYWVHARCEGLSDERYQILSYLPDSIEFTCSQCSSSPNSVWRNAVEAELKAGFIGVIKSLSKNRKVCTALKWSPQKECSCRPSKKVDLDDKVETSPSESEECSKSEEHPSDSNRRGLRRLRQKFHLKECSVRVKNCALEGEKSQLITENPNDAECTCSEQQILVRPSPTLMSVKQKVTNNEYKTLSQFHCDMEHVINRVGAKELVDAYHDTLREVFPWFSPKNPEKCEEPPARDMKEDSLVKLDDSILEVWKEEVMRAPKAIAAKTANLYNANVEDSRSCCLCKGLGDGSETKEGRLLYCGQNEWVHSNCALWSNEVFEEIDGSLQNVHSAISRGRLIRCSECGKKGASVGCCAKNCSSTFHYPCARNVGLAFNDDKTVFCSSHLSSCKTLQSEGEFSLRRPVYVELDRKKKKYAEPNKVKVMIGSLMIDCLGTVIPEYSDSAEKIIPCDYKCSRLYWSTVNPFKIVRYYIRTYVQVFVPEVSSDLENNVTIDHSKEQERESALEDEYLVARQTLDALVDAVCNKEVDENLAEQSNTDLLPPELKEAIFEDLPHDLLDGISMQDIFPKMTYEDFLAMDLKNDGTFATDLFKDDMLAPEVDEIIKPLDNKISKIDPSLLELGPHNDLWVHLETKTSVQDLMDDLFSSKKRGGRELKRSKSEVMSNSPLIVGGQRHHQRSCSLTWSCKLDGTYGPNIKRRKLSRNSSMTKSQTETLESQTERPPTLHELRIPDGIMVTVGRANTPNILSDSVRELKYCIEDASLNRRVISTSREEGKEHKRLFWHARQQPRILQVDGPADPSSASECSSPEYSAVTESIPQLDGINDESCDSEDSSPCVLRSKRIYGFLKSHNNLKLNLEIPQLDGADDVSSDDECGSPHIDRPVTCQRCRCTYRTQDSYNRHLASCDTMVTSDSDSETMDNKLASPDSRFSPQFITLSPSEGHTLSSDYPDLQATSPLEASVPSPHPAIQIEPIAQAIITPQIHTHATVETVHQTVLTSNDMIVQTQYTRTTTTLPNATVLPQESTVQITEITDPPGDSSLSQSSPASQTTPSPQVSPTFSSTGVQTASEQTCQMTKLKSKSPRAPKSRAKGIKAQIVKNTIQPHNGHRFQPVQNSTPVILQQTQRPSGPTVILQQVASPGIMSAYVETLQQQGQNLQYVTTIGGQHEAAFKPQFITTNHLVPGAYIQSDNLLALQNGGISILPGVQIAQPQPTVLGTIIQQQPNAIQCGVISSEQLLLSSTPTLEMFTDSTGSMFLSNQPMYYGLETIVSNTVMSSSQFMAGTVPQVLASSYQTTTQVFQASKLMEPIVDVQVPTVTAVPSVSNMASIPIPTVPNIPNASGMQNVLSAPNIPAPSAPSMPSVSSVGNIPAVPSYVVVNQTPALAESIVTPQINIPVSESFSPMLPVSCQEMEPQVTRVTSSPKLLQNSIPRVAVRPSPVAQANNGPWKITEPLFGSEQISNSVRPYFDSKHVSENTSMIKSSISSKIPPLPNHCITQRDMIVNKLSHDVNSVHSYSSTSSNSVNVSTSSNPVISSTCMQNKPSSVPTSRPMNRVLPMQAVTPKQDTAKPEMIIEEPTKPEIKPAEPEPKKMEVVEPAKKPETTISDISDMKLSTESIEKVKENLKLELDKEKLQNASLKIVLQKQLQDGSYKITHNMKAVTQNKKSPQVTSVEILPTKQVPQIASLQLLPIKTFTLKANKIDEKKPINVLKTKAPPVAVKKPRVIKSNLQTQKACSKGPMLMYEIKSQDGFTHTASSMAEVWETVFQAVQSARKAHNLPPLPHNPLSENLGLENNATVYLVEQLPDVNRCTKYKPRFHSLTPPKTGEGENDLPTACDNGAARAEPFKGRKVHDMFSWLASRHRQQPKLIAISEAESRRVTSTNLPMAMRFRILKETSKESVGVYHSHIHGRGLFCLRDIEAGEMVIEYAGEVIRASLTDKREKYYDSKNIGCYMFKIDDHLVVDATMKGNAARFINHSCEPNCYSRVVDILGKKHILIFALRRINQGEELTYDYKFPFEDIKIPCTCGSRRCRKYLN